MGWISWSGGFFTGALGGCLRLLGFHNTRGNIAYRLVYILLCLLLYFPGTLCLAHAGPHSCRNVGGNAIFESCRRIVIFNF